MRSKKWDCRVRLSERRSFSSRSFYRVETKTMRNTFDSTFRNNVLPGLWSRNFQKKHYLIPGQIPAAVFVQGLPHPWSNPRCRLRPGVAAVLQRPMSRSSGRSRKIFKKYLIPSQIRAGNFIPPHFIPPHITPTQTPRPSSPV